MSRTFCLLTALALLAGGLLLFEPATASAQGSTANVAPIDLAFMALPLDALPADFAQLQFAMAGFDSNRRDPGEMNAYVIQYVNRNPQQGQVLFVETGAALFTDSSAAMADVPYQEQGFQHAFTNVQTAPIADLGEQAVSLTGDVHLGEQTVSLTGEVQVQSPGPRVTAVLFQFGRLAGVVAVFRTDSTDIRAQTEMIARALYARMKGVKSGAVTGTTAPLPPDVNCDGTVNAVDAALILQLEAAFLHKLACGRIADANRDGQTNAIDAALILQYSAGLLHRLPV